MSRFVKGILTAPLIFKYYKNPFEILFGILLKKEINLILKNDTPLTISSNLSRKSMIEGILRTVLVLKNGWAISKIDENFLFKKENIHLIQPNLGVLTEDMNSMYKVTNFKDKVVLDVGGYFGETAVLFGVWGAQKIIIYEPLAAHNYYISKNTKLNKVKSNIICAAVSKKSGFETWNIKDTDIYNAAFGLKNKGEKKIKIKTVSWENVLKKAIKEKVSFAKVDCEGGELFLKYAPNKLISRIPEWLIEYHSISIKKEIIEKFLSCGFDYKLTHKLNAFTGILHFLPKLSYSKVNSNAPHS